MIAIIDYGMGNLRSVEKALEKIGYKAVVSGDPTVIRGAQGVILPGVGAYADCMTNLTATGMDAVVHESIAGGKPFLGICLGLQLLFEESEEDGIYKGLGIFKGKVRRLPEGQKIPHMGWNQVRYANKPPVFDGVADGSNFYFVHSYYVDSADTGIIATTTGYGIDFISGIWSDNVVAVQFHPEKSGDVGLKVLDNFGRLCG